MEINRNGLKKMNRNMSLDAVLRFSRNMVDMKESYTYADYLQKCGPEVEREFGATVILPVIDKDSFVLKELSQENHRNSRTLQALLEGEISSGDVIQLKTKLFHHVKYLVFVPLPVFDKDVERQKYTVLGCRRKMGRHAVGCIFMLFYSMYIFFQAQHERGEHQKMYFSMLSLIISVIDAKDPVTAGHSQRVADISRDIGIWLELNMQQQHDLEITALLHDIGKISVSDYVLTKPSVYTKEDFEQMKHHTVRGAEMLAEVGIDKEMVDGVRHHHERIDGKGYPDGLKGDQLSLFAKIIKIADVFDALTSKRQYKEAWKINKALDIIYQGRGTEFDADITDVFIENMRPAGWTPPVLEKSKDFYKQSPMLKKAVSILDDFYQRYHDYILAGYPVPSRKAEEISLTGENGFMGFDWGETFHNPLFLENKPVILSYERDTESLFFGQSSKAAGVKDIYFYFFRGFLNMGMFLLESSVVPQALDELCQLYGEPFPMDSQISIFVGKKFRVVYYHTYDEKELLCYISDYMCSNYKCDTEEKV